MSAWELGAILSAIALAAVGGELFLRGVIGLAGALRIPKAVVATTVAAFATSSPELTVSIVAALEGKPELGLGDALGSNVVNIALVLGLALLIRPLPVDRNQFSGSTFYLALFVPLLTLGLAHDGRIGPSEGAILLAIFIAWLARLVWTSRRERPSPEAASTASCWRSLLVGGIGLAALGAAGRLFVHGATGAASALGIDVFVVGALIVAIGTSLPELVTVLFSRLRGHDDVGLGTLLGSNLFNGLAIVGTTAVIHPIGAPIREIALTLIVGGVSLLLLRSRKDVLGARVGGLLLLLYLLFVAWSYAIAHYP